MNRTPPHPLRMRLTQLLVPLVAIGIAAAPVTAQRPGIRYNAITGDSVEIIGLFPMAIGAADSAFIFMYRTFLPLGDFAGARREALPWFGWFQDQFAAGGYRHAAIWVVWPQTDDDSLLTEGPRGSYAIQFVEDPRNCWHVVNDTTTVQHCPSDSTAAGPPR
jgi:hypothetical protein